MHSQNEEYSVYACANPKRRWWARVCCLCTAHSFNTSTLGQSMDVQRSRGGLGVGGWGLDD